jgi:Tol biopolymer transport system component
VAFAALDTTDTPEFDRTRTAIYVVDVDGSNLQQVSPIGISLCPCLKWSPDATWIATSAGDNEAGREQIFLVRPDGTDFHQVSDLPPPGSCCAVWSPDGARFVGYDLRVFNRDGSRAFAIEAGPIVGSYAYAWVAQP